MITTSSEDLFECNLSTKDKKKSTSIFISLKIS